jgi:hypothetical protein
VDPSVTPYAAAFPEANLAAQDESGDNYAYFRVTSSEYTLHGVANPALTVVYQDPEELMIFPLTLGTTNTDDLYAEFTSGIDIIRSGTTVSTGDAYGTLILPSGTFTDVLRVKVEEDYSDEYVGIPLSLNYNFDLYYWFKEGVTGPLLQYFNQNVDGLVTETLYMNNDIEVVTEVENLTISEIKVYPNPASENITISISNNANRNAENLVIYDVSGKVVYEEQLNSTDQIQINLSSLISGIYVIHFQTENGNITRTFTKN